VGPDDWLVDSIWDPLNNSAEYCVEADGPRFKRNLWGDLWAVTSESKWDDEVHTYSYGFVKERPCSLLDKQASGPDLP
jgi:hypothetical protein